MVNVELLALRLIREWTPESSMMVGSSLSSCLTISSSICSWVLGLRSTGWGDTFEILKDSSRGSGLVGDVLAGLSSFFVVDFFKLEGAFWIGVGFGTIIYFLEGVCFAGGDFSVERAPIFGDRFSFRSVGRSVFLESIRGSVFLLGFPLSWVVGSFLTGKTLLALGFGFSTGFV